MSLAKNLKVVIFRVIIFGIKTLGALHAITVEVVRNYSHARASQLSDEFLSKLTSTTQVISQCDTTKFFFYTPNLTTTWRAMTLESKEPDIIEWMVRFGGKNKFLLDVGANVGMYSIYYAKKLGPAIAVEPSAFNLPILVKNISLNHLEKEIIVIPCPVTNNDGVSDFLLSSMDQGSALNAFGVDYTFDGSKLETSACYQTFGLTLDTLIELGIIKEIPSMVKIDVDGIEDKILEGASSILDHPQCETVFIEVNLNFESSKSRIYQILKEFDFNLIQTTPAGSADDILLEHCQNQIWLKRSAPR